MFQESPRQQLQGREEWSHEIEKRKTELKYISGFEEKGGRAFPLLEFLLTQVVTDHVKLITLQHIIFEQCIIHQPYCMGKLCHNVHFNHEPEKTHHPPMSVTVAPAMVEEGVFLLAPS